MSRDRWHSCGRVTGLLALLLVAVDCAPDRSTSPQPMDTAAPLSQRTPGALWRGRKAFDE